MSLVIRPLVAADLAFAHSLSRLAGWNQTRRDWERFLELGPGGCFLAEWESRPAGTASTTCYGGELAWIGMVLVHPDYRRRGLGTALLRRAIAHLREERGIACVRLDATPEGRPLYEGLGFRAEWGLRRWMRETGPAGAGPAGAGPAGPMAVQEAAIKPMPVLEAPVDPRALGSALLALDREVFGADRSELLRSLASGSWAAESLADGSFGLAREGERATYLGPVTAASTLSGVAVVESLARRCPADGAVYWDLPDQNRAAIELAATQGFRPVRELTRMWLGDAPLPSDPTRIFGLAEPGFG